MDKPPPERPLGDMPAEEFRTHGQEVVDWIARYLANPEANPVFSRSSPGDIRASQPTTAPEAPTPFDRIFDDFQHTIVPGITHWNHPGFFAYFAVSGSAPGILGEALAAALNVNAMLWRTSPAATELEELSLDWLRQMLGLPAVFRGHIQDTASTSTMVAIAAAREAMGMDIRREGMAGRELPRLRVYCSQQAHSSIDKAAITLGVGLNGVTHIPTDASYRMSPDALEASLEADIAAGVRPLAVVATIGTTSTTSVDPIAAIAAICARRSVWLHIDAAYGGAAALMPEMRPLMAGWDLADSIVVNPHKWLFVPIDCSALFFRDHEIATRTYSLVADYLTTGEGEAATNLMEYGPALGRRFRSLKLWMTLRYFGRVGIADRIAEHIRLAHLFASWVADDPDWEILAPVPFSTVCFRCRPPSIPHPEIDSLNQVILDRVNASGEVFLSHTRLRGRLTLRLAVGNIRTEERHVARAWTLLREAARRE
jgi:aromatic-L-amino-acid decarboxylase